MGRDNEGDTLADADCMPFALSTCRCVDRETVRRTVPVIGKAGRASGVAAPLLAKADQVWRMIENRRNERKVELEEEAAEFEGDGR